eukprot:TRINITY_DN18849_c0_g1_i1.p1 TRINITY_DN18849_c0_g1~~TRINITY_DN18849_c0_g1_i1.p1  ORF type:complete len:474 (+),score=198.67 TRINITY_DN18849_c0_g1_i1:90-1511(+)
MAAATSSGSQGGSDGQGGGGGTTLPAAAPSAAHASERQHIASREHMVSAGGTSHHSPPLSPVHDRSTRSIRQRLRALQRTLQDGETSAMSQSPRVEAQRRHLLRMVHTLTRHEVQQAKQADMHRLSVLDRAEDQQYRWETELTRRREKKEAQAAEALKEARTQQSEDLKKHADRWFSNMTQARTKVHNGLMEHRSKMDQVRDLRQQQSERWEREKKRKAEEREERRNRHMQFMQERMERLAEENLRKERERDEENNRRVAEQNRRLAQARQEKHERALRAEQKRLRFIKKHSDLTAFEARSERFVSKVRDRERKLKDLEEQRGEAAKERLDKQRKVRETAATHYAANLDSMFGWYEDIRTRREEHYQMQEQRQREADRLRRQKQRERDMKLEEHRDKYAKREEERKELTALRNFERWQRHAESFSKGAEEFSKLLASPRYRVAPSPPSSARRQHQGAAGGAGPSPAAAQAGAT